METGSPLVIEIEPGYCPWQRPVKLRIAQSGTAYAHRDRGIATCSPAPDRHSIRGTGGTMEFYYQNVDDGVLVLSADGGLDRGTAEQFVGELRKLVESGASKIIVDCTKLNYVSLHGLSTLFGLHKKLADHGGDVKVAAVRGKIAGLVAESRLSDVLHVYPYVDRARHAFRRRDA